MRIETNRDAKMWGMLCHLAALSGWSLLPGLGWVLGPLLVWLFKKDDSPFVDKAGREAINFHLNVLIFTTAAGLISLVPFAAFVTIPAILFVALAQLVLAFVATVQSSKGTAYKYPGTFLKLV